MILTLLKEFFVPGSITFLLIALLPGVALLFRRKNGGRAGKIWVAGLVLAYWVLSTPIAAVALVRAFSPLIPPIQSPADARGATAIVVLGAGIDIHRSRDAVYGVPKRDGSLRVLEAARLFRVLDPALVIVTGGFGSAQYSEASLMTSQLQQLGVPASRIVTEKKSMSTRDHAIYVPPMLTDLGVNQFILVTSQQHIGRALATFRSLGQDPVPATPEVYASGERPFAMYLPSRTALSASEHMLYEAGAWLLYRARGWV